MISYSIPSSLRVVNIVLYVEFLLSSSLFIDESIFVSVQGSPHQLQY